MRELWAAHKVPVLGLALAVFMLLVWPTPYRYETDSVRINRLTGEMQGRTATGRWERAPEPTAEERAKIDRLTRDLLGRTEEGRSVLKLLDETDQAAQSILDDFYSGLTENQRKALKEAMKKPHPPRPFEFEWQFSWPDLSVEELLIVGGVIVFVLWRNGQRFVYELRRRRAKRAFEDAWTRGRAGRN